MRIELLFFAQLRDAMGSGSEVITVDDGATVDSVLTLLRGRAQWRGVEALPLTFAVNEVVVDSSRLLRDGDVLALLPPVSGG